MRNFFKWIGFVCVLQYSMGIGAWAQTTINGGRVITGAWDASNASSSKPAKTGALLPQTCSIGEQFFKTDASQGQNLYFCTASNTWVQMTGGSGSGSGGGGSSAPNVLIYKGDLSGFANQNVRIPVGPDGATLTADSTQGSGLGYRNSSESNIFSNRPVCTPALTGETYYPTDGVIAYRCNGSSWSGFGPISPVTPLRTNGANAFGIAAPGSSLLSVAASSSGNLALVSCQSFPSTVTMVVVDSEVIAGTCSGTNFTPITGGRGYNQTTAVVHNAGAAVTEQLFVWTNTVSGVTTQGTSTVSASSGYIAMTANAGSNGSPSLAKPIPYGPNASYTVTGGFILNGLATGDQGCGIGFRQSSNNKQVLVLFHSITYSQAGFVVGAYQFSDGAYIGGYFGDLAAFMLTGNGIYFRLQDTGVQRNIYVSSDGVNFVLVHAIGDGDFLVPDQVFIQCNGGNIPQGGNFFSWSEGR
jgi:hypothetical protein